MHAATQRLHALLVPLILVSACAAVRAADAPAAGQPYRVQPGDVLEITLWNEDAGPQSFKVGPEGGISYPLVGLVMVKGLTQQEIQDRLTQELAKQIRKPLLTVALKQVGGSDIGFYVLGAVGKPGPYPLVEGMRLKDAIGLAGGLLPDADGARAILTTQRGAIPVDLEKLITQGDETANLLLARGDMLTVPAGARNAVAATKNFLTVILSGQVNHPGPLQLPQGTRVSDAVTAAGGLTPMAALKNATLARSGQVVALDLEAVLRRNEPTWNLPLQNGDLILVPEARIMVALLGEFGKQGATLCKPGDTLADALIAGGGPTDRADLRRAILRRAGQDTTIDLKPIVEGRDLSANRPVQDGDTLILPRRSQQVTLFGEFRRPGTYEFRENDTLSRAVELAGGTTADADLRHATLRRGTQESPIDLKSMLQGGENQPVEDGDTITVPRRNSQVTILGEVAKPGTYPFADDDTLTQAMALAGGPTDDADLRRAVLTRNGAQTPVDLQSILKENNLKGNLALESGDSLFIPAGIRILTFGDGFQKPGAVCVGSDMKLLEVLQAAGGIAKNARLDRAVVMRMNGGKPKPIELDIRNALAKGGPVLDFTFQKGDVLTIPSRSQGSNWQTWLGTISTLAVTTSYLFRY